MIPGNIVSKYTAVRSLKNTHVHSIRRHILFLTLIMLQFLWRSHEYRIGHGMWDRERRSQSVGTLSGIADGSIEVVGTC